MRHVNITEYIKENGFHSGRDEELDTLTIDEADEDRVCLGICTV